MTLLGLPLAQLAVAFAAVGGAVTLLYILRLRRRRVTVPFAQLWQRVMRQKESTSLFHRLRRLLSLLLQLAFIALLLFALGNPKLSETVLEGRQIIMLIDASASMRTKDTEKGTRLELAKAEARKLIRGLGGADTLMLVRMDDQATPLTGFSSDPAALMRKVDELKASHAPADLHRALRFCADSLRAQRNPMLVMITDGAFRPGDIPAVRWAPGAPAQLTDAEDKGNKPQPAAKKPAPKKAEPKKAPTKVAKKRTAKEKAEDLRNSLAVDLSGIKVRGRIVGNDANNVGIVSFAARRYISNKLAYELFLDVVNYSKHPIAFNLELHADGILSDVKQVRLAAGERRRLSCTPEDRAEGRKTWCDLSSSGEVLEARLLPLAGKGELDAFPLDNKAFALLPQRRKMKVLLVSKGNLFLEGALLLDENVDVKRVLPKNFSAAKTKDFDAVVLDSFIPDETFSKHTLYVNPPPGKGPFKTNKVAKAPLVTEQNTSHPVMRYITLKDVNISRATTFRKSPGDTVLASSFRAPIAIAHTKKGRREVAFGFDPKQSDLPLRVAFPMLIVNTVSWFSGEGSDLVDAYSMGQTWHVTLPDASQGADTATINTPSGGRLTAPVDQGRAVIHGSEIGLYTVQHASGTTRFAANLANPAESNVRPAKRLKLGKVLLEPPKKFDSSLRREIWIYILLIGIALSMLEWWTYNRRMTV